MPRAAQTRFPRAKPLVGIDLERRVATTSEAASPVRAARVFRAVRPARATGWVVATKSEVFTWNKVLVFNLGFDRKGQRDVHWVYYPSRELSFIEVGLYDNIFDTERA